MNWRKQNIIAIRVWNTGKRYRDVQGSERSKAHRMFFSMIKLFETGLKEIEI